MFLAASSPEAVAVLGAVKHVALVHPQHRVVPVDQMLLEAAGQLAFRPPVEVDVEALVPVAPEQVGALVTDPDLRQLAGNLCTLAAVTTGELQDDRLREAVRMNHALGQHEEVVHDLLELARHHQRWVRADLLRRNLATFPGLTEEMAAHGATPYTGSPDDQALAARYQALGDLPEGTFGRAYFAHFREHGFGFPGEVGALVEGFAGPHDSVHVLSGYGTSTQGEMLVSAFTAGMHPEGAMEAHILPTLLEWQVGLDLSFAVAPEKGWLDPRKELVAIQRGQACRRDVLDGSWDVFSVAERPLEELRAEYGIPPLDPADAGIGIEPHGR